MKLTPALIQYQTERDNQIERVITALWQDERVWSAWVFGSLGRGDADALSDIDLIIVVQEEQLQAVIAERFSFAEKLGQPLFFLEAPQNAPKGGAYWMMCFDDSTAPHIIDVYWQSERLEWDSSQARLLFERKISTPSSIHPLPPNRAEMDAACQELPHEARFFWMMFLIVAKYVYRDPHALEMPLLHYLFEAYEGARRKLGEGEPLNQDCISASIRELDEKVDMLRYLAERMIALLAFASPQTKENLFPSVYRYLAMVEEAVVP